MTGDRRAPEPDRVLATVLFTDIVGSTEKAAELGEATAQPLTFEDLFADQHERSSRTRSFSTVIERVQPIRSAITVAGMSGQERSSSCSRGST